MGRERERDKQSVSFVVDGSTFWSRSCSSLATPIVIGDIKRRIGLIPATRLLYITTESERHNKSATWAPALPASLATIGSGQTKRRRWKWVWKREKCEFYRLFSICSSPLRLKPFLISGRLIYQKQNPLKSAATNIRLWGSATSKAIGMEAQKSSMPFRFTSLRFVSAFSLCPLLPFQFRFQWARFAINGHHHHHHHIQLACLLSIWTNKGSIRMANQIETERESRILNFKWESFSQFHFKANLTTSASRISAVYLSNI